MSDGDLVYRQVELSYEDTKLVCWVEMDADVMLKPGMRITLKGIPGLWDVRLVYSLSRHDHPRRTWRVGGVHDR